MRGYPCDEQYIEALGRAVFNFAILEYTVAYIIERLEPDYLREYISKKKTATRVAQDFAQALQRAKEHAAEAELTAFQSVFVDLKDRRDRLLRWCAAPSGTRHSLGP
jgi:molecular chaperone GrpE (heat shock protein)